MDQKRLTHLRQLEAESIHIIREVAAEFSNPVMMYSIGKDSSVMLHLARKAFYPGTLPFPLLHVDTGWKFREMYEFRDRTAKAYGCELLVHKNPEGVAMGINPFVHGSAKHTDIMKTEGLKQALNKYGFDAAFGGARATKRNPAPKSASTPSATASTAGTRKTSVRSCGTTTTARLTKAKASASSRSPTGPSWISGSTSIWKILKSCRCIWPLSARCWSATAC
jgi:sulfate adenylyltransferase subunit 2